MPPMPPMPPMPRLPTLAYQSATGFVCQLKSQAPDLPFNYTPPVIPGGASTYALADGNPMVHVPANLLANKANDRT